MDKALIVAIASAVVKKHLESNPPLRGLRGRDGKSFSFDAYKDQIADIVVTFIESIKSDLKLNFSDLTKTEINSIKLKFSDLTGDEKTSLKGPRGQKGRDGKKGRHGKDGRSFDLSENKDEVSKIISDYVDTLDLKGEKGERGRPGQKGRDGKDGAGFVFENEKIEIAGIIDNFLTELGDDLKLKFSDLSIEDRKELKGEKGPRGQKGKDFSFEKHREEIDDIIKSYIDGKNEQIYDFTKKVFEENKDLLKLKFSDFNDEEKTEIKGDKGSRGQRGKDGRRGLSAYELWIDDGNSGDETDFLKTLVGNRGPSGIQGLPGLQGIQGLKGIDGQDGLSAPQIVDIEIKKVRKDVYRFDFFFDNGMVISSNNFKMPEKRELVQQIVQGFSGSGAGSRGTITDTVICDEVISALKLVRSTSPNNARLANKTDYVQSKVLGIALTAGGVGDYIRVLTFGEVKDNFFNFSLNEPLFLGASGVVTDTPPTSEFSVNVGYGLGTGAIFVDIREQIEL